MYLLLNLFEILIFDILLMIFFVDDLSPIEITFCDFPTMSCYTWHYQFTFISVSSWFEPLMVFVSLHIVSLTHGAYYRRRYLYCRCILGLSALKRFLVSYLWLDFKALVFLQIQKHPQLIRVNRICTSLGSFPNSAYRISGRHKCCK